MSELLTLLILHHLADVAFQPTWLIKGKYIHWFRVYEHSFIWAGVISLGLYFYNDYSLAKFIALLAGHFIIDFCKYRYFPKQLILDQELHYLQVITVIGNY